nr:MAG TPA: hypothetical protein [Caudoviricetes sp.]
MCSGIKLWEKTARKRTTGGFSFAAVNFVKLRVAKVNLTCYYGFARYIKAFQARAFSLGSGFVLQFATHEFIIQLV